jgi:hypothetical protein
LAGTLKEQLNPSALLPALPAAKAALVALMQITSSAAVAISIVNLMAGSSPKLSRSLSFPALSWHQTRFRGCREIGPVLA